MRRTLPGLLMATLLVLTPSAAGAAPGHVDLASVASDGSQADNASGDFPAVSSDGRYVAFDSSADNLVEGDTNGMQDVFLRDVEARTTSRVSVATGGGEADGDSDLRTGGPAISASGRFVVFSSAATNLVANDENEHVDVFLRDTTLGLTTLVSHGEAEDEADGDSTYPSVSANGRYVAFVSTAENLVEGDENDEADVFPADTWTGQTSRISVASSGAEGNGFSAAPAISGNGRSVAFESAASNLVSGDTNGVTDVFVRDVAEGTTSRVSVSEEGVEGNGNSELPSISRLGRFVAFESGARNLVADDTNDARDIFVTDRSTGGIERVDVSSTGDEAFCFTNPFHCQGNHNASLSADGRYVAFDSDSPNLVAKDTNRAADVFVHDRTTGRTVRLSVAEDGSEGNDASIEPVVAWGAGLVAYRSSATNLVSGDENGVVDIFVAHRVV